MRVQSRGAMRPVPPPWGRDERIDRDDFSKGKSGIFFESALDTDLLICPTGRSRAKALPYQRGLAPEPAEACRTGVVDQGG